MTVLVVSQYLLGTVVLLVDHLQHLIVHDLCGGFRIGTLELVFRVVVVADVGQLVAHAGVCYHAVGLLGGTLQIVHGTRRYVADEELLGSTSAQE